MLVSVFPLLCKVIKASYVHHNMAIVIWHGDTVHQPEFLKGAFHLNIVHASVKKVADMIQKRKNPSQHPLISMTDIPKADRAESKGKEAKEDFRGHGTQRARVFRMMENHNTSSRRPAEALLVPKSTRVHFLMLLGNLQLQEKPSFSYKQ